MNQIKQPTIISYDSAEAFSHQVGSFLQKNPALNATIIANLDMILNGDSVFNPPYWFGLVRDAEGLITACGIHALPDGLLVSGLDTSRAREFCEKVSEDGVLPSRVMAEPEVAKTLSDYWTSSTATDVALVNHWNVYLVDDTTLKPVCVSGTLRRGVESDSQIVRDWGEQYAKEKPAFLNIATYFLRKLSRDELFLWEDDGAKALCVVSKGCANSIRISGVYTPPQSRGRGYAGAAVSGICRTFFDNGTSFVTLLARRGDSAERLYGNLGFESVGRQSSYTFKTTN